ncbi:MAG TPA: hypothetical protein VNG33_19390 [Polyangiaceae bacterium]|nr:hypothetical protein [Polyangiaceae bacterium]
MLPPRRPFALPPVFAWPLFAAWLSGCAAPSAPLASPPGASAGSEQAPGATGDRAAQSGSSTGQGVKPVGAAAGAFPAAPLPGGEEPTPDKALPELHIEALGMHVGGGKNSPEEKAPFQRALERQFPAFLGCYRLADDAWAGGSFGIDLKIARAGGAPSVEQPRTKIHGAGFQDCMLAAFGKVAFEKPKAGPTVISYSVMFTLGKAKR